MTLRRLLHEELTRRQLRNRRYSLRAFARDLAMHHASLSRVMRGRQRVRSVTLAEIAQRLRLAPDVVLQSALADADAAVLAAVGHPKFRTDSRWLAMMTGLSLDEVNASLQRLLRKRMLQMVSRQQWLAIADV